MSIIRSPRPEANFTIIENSLIYSQSLDWRELGLLIYLLSKPDNWTISITHLAKQKETGVSGIKAAIKKLKQSGYVVMKRSSSGHVNWYIYDEPQDDNQLKDKPQVEKPHVEKPHVENQLLISTERTITTENNNKTSLPSVRKSCFEPEEYRQENLNAQAWQKYCRYRKTDIKKPLKTERGCKTQASLLSQHPPDIQQQMVDQSIDNEWIKIVELKHENQQSIHGKTNNAATRYHQMLKQDWSRVMQDGGDPNIPF